MAEASQRPKSESKEDRISNLPDFLIQHILSLLLTTKQAIRTTVLSKRWHNQWTHVPVLIFNSNGTFGKNILKLHNCSKIKKINYQYNCFDYWGEENDSYFDEIVAFATRRHVEDFELKCFDLTCKVVPELFFDNISLRKLRIRECNFMPKGKVNWVSLKELSLSVCSLTNEAIEHILCGSPLLELMNISFCHGYDKFVVTSEYLKRLVLESQELCVLEISCPNLKELSFWGIQMKDWTMFGPAIKYVLSVSSLLESFKLVSCKALGHLVISSESLKILDIGHIRHVSCLQVSCSRLEKLDFKGILNFGKVEFVNLPSLVRVHLDLPHQGETTTREIQERLIKDILQQLHHVDELKLGSEFIKVLPDFEPRDLYAPMLCNKCLNLDQPGWFEYQSRVAFILRNSPMLETLVITDSDYERFDEGDPKLTDVQENFWSLTEIVFDCLESHLKTVRIIGTPISDNKRKLLVNFLRFLLKNARVLETMDVTSIHLRTFREILLSSPKRSQHAVIKFRERN